jgi:hypothetical protein
VKKVGAPEQKVWFLHDRSLPMRIVCPVVAMK